VRVIIAIVIILVLLALMITLRSIMVNVRRKLSIRVSERFAKEDILLQSLDANFFGFKSKGKKQIRGNGALVLTREELWFSRVLPQMEISIPIRNIRTVKLVRSHLGKTVFRPLLLVEFFHRGREDAIAWLVKNPEEWQKKIEELRRQDGYFG